MSESTPEPFLKGRFNMWETPEGGYHIAYVPDDSAETRHLEIPGMVVRMGKLASEGKLNPVKAMREIMSHESA